MSNSFGTRVAYCEKEICCTRFIGAVYNNNSEDGIFIQDNEIEKYLNYPLVAIFKRKCDIHTSSVVDNLHNLEFVGVISQYGIRDILITQYTGYDARNLETSDTLSDISDHFVSINGVDEKIENITYIKYITTNIDIDTLIATEGVVIMDFLQYPVTMDLRK